MRRITFRILMAFLLTAGLLLSSGSLACEHYPGQVEYEELIQNGYIPPQAGVPGSTGNRLCPLCGAVCIAAEEIPALPEPADHPAAQDGEQPTEGANPSPDAEKPDANPEPQELPAGSGGQQEEKEETLLPVQPETPAGGEGSSGQDSVPAAEQPAAGSSDTASQSALVPQPEQAAVIPPESPGGDESSQPEQPAVVQPENGGQGAEVQPEQPAVIPPENTGKETEVQPEQPAVMPPENGGQGTAGQPESSDQDVPVRLVPIEENPQETAQDSQFPPEAEVSAPAEGAEPAESGGAAAAGASAPVRKDADSGRVRVDSVKPGDFSFRRTHFHPEPGIWAEAAGELIWPVYATPFQQKVKP